MTRVVVLDHGSGNLRSAERALAAAGADAVVTADLGAARDADGLVVPGVGAFAAVVADLRRVGGDEVVRERVAAGRPVLGICVGMQVLFDEGVEHGVATPGLGLFAGTVGRLDADVVPLMGWTEVEPDARAALLGPSAGERFYFVHSYAATRPPADTQVTWATHGRTRFLAAVERGPLAATQFHPEKSGAAGIALLRRWVGSL